MKIYFQALFILLLSAISLAAKAQLTVSATVTDEKNLPIPGATVFITNTKYIAATDINGKFRISNLPGGTYELAVKMLGFAPAIQTVILNNEPLNLHIKLKENSKELKTVDIKDKTNSNRAKYLEIFRKRFIGESINSPKCKILNPDVISFHYDDETKVLTASSDAILEIENSGLGYKVNYLLTNFEANLNDLTFFFSGHPYFVDMQGAADQEKKWNDNRIAAYIGSVRHFFRAVVNNTAELDGFNIFTSVDVLDGKKLKKVIRELPADSIFDSLGPNNKILKDKYDRHSDGDTTALFVIYRGGDLPAHYKPSFYVKLPTKYSSSADQLSKMEPLASEILVDKNGSLLPAHSFIMSGFWASQRVAELTPLDFVVEFKHDKITQKNYEKKVALPDTSHDKEDHMRTQILMLQNEPVMPKPPIRHP